MSFDRFPWCTRCEVVALGYREPSWPPERGRAGIPKAEWGPGPWQDEPDHISPSLLENGVWIALHRNAMGGTWCGYAGIPEGHPLYQRGSSDDRVGDLEVHGGVTWVGELPFALPEHPEAPDGLWWFGFDCAHLFDVMPAMDAQMRALTGKPSATSRLLAMPGFGLPGGYRTQQYAIEQALRLAAQLADAAH